MYCLMQRSRHCGWESLWLVIDCLQIVNASIHWCTSLKYLAIFFQCGYCLNCDIDNSVRILYGSKCNVSHCILASELSKLFLMESYCLLLINYSCEALIMHLSLLFKGMARHKIVPDPFGVGVIIPLLKDKEGDCNSIDNYRGITLCPVISKLFEL